MSENNMNRKMSCLISYQNIRTTAMICVRIVSKVGKCTAEIYVSVAFAKGGNLNNNNIYSIDIFSYNLSNNDICSNEMYSSGFTQSHRQLFIIQLNQSIPIISFILFIVIDFSNMGSVFKSSWSTLVNI